MGLDVAAGADREEAGNSMMVREEVLQLAVESVQDGREAAEVVAIDVGARSIQCYLKTEMFVYHAVRFFLVATCCLGL